MLRDRIVLLDKEVVKNKAHCADLYRSLVIHGDGNGKNYEASLSRLTALMEEQKIVSEMIAAGSK